MLFKVGIVILSFVILTLSEECTEVGFFRSEQDCSSFYRCVDFYNIGKFTKFDFVCPEGLVFDETLSVCNWPEQSAPCEEVTTVGEMESSGDGSMTTEDPDSVEYEEDTEGSGGAEEDSSNVIITPSFDYECTEEGLFGHDSNCAKFWLCKESNGSLDPAELYRCPDGYEFDESVLRCQKEEDVDCEKTADSVQERLESPARTLTVSELDSFFSKWSF